MQSTVSLTLAPCGHCSTGNSAPAPPQPMSVPLLTPPCHKNTGEQERNPCPKLLPSLSTASQAGYPPGQHLRAGRDAPCAPGCVWLWLPAQAIPGGSLCSTEMEEEKEV